LTGASGFIGRHTIPYLLKNGCEVHALFRDHEPEIKDRKGLLWHKCDILDPAARERLCDEIKASHLLHFAWCTAPGEYWTSPENMKWEQASLDLVMKFADNGGKRAVIAGTCAEYDWGHGYCSEEGTPLNPASLYGACKCGLENSVRQFSAEAGLSYAWGRIFYVYGPYENPERLIPSVIRALQEKRVACCTHGDQVRDFLHVEDVASAFVSLLLSDVDGPVNIASGQPVKLREVVLAVADHFGAGDKVEFGVVPAPEKEAELIVSGSTRLADEVGWRPKYDLGSGIAQTVRYWQEKTHK